MKRQLLNIILAVSFSSTSIDSAAQQVHPFSGEPLKHCGLTEATEELYKQYPHLKAEVEVFENQQNNQTVTPKTGLQTNQLPPVYKIPVVFHVLHNYGPENIPDANVQDAVRILNELFRKQNSDISQAAFAFQGIAGDAEVEFELAKLDPNGNCTNGIDRVVTYKTYKAGDGQNGSNVSKINMWPRDKYLNIYSVNNINNGAAGYTYPLAYLAANPSIDGIIIRYDYVGALSPSSALTSRSLAHEVGHWFNLAHTWGNTNQPGILCGDDGVTDTPVTKGWTSCNLTSNDVCNPGIEENVENIMEYSYCDKMFTQGQCTRMRTALQGSTAQRNNLWTTANLAVTGVSTPAVLCKADFTTNKKIICAGAAVTFTDLSGSVTPTSWQWDFDNNSTVDATIKNPTYTFTVPGTYSVTLTVSDGTTTKSITQPSLIIVLGNSATAYVPFSESFENGSFPYSDSYVTSYNTLAATSWNRVTTAGYTGTASLKLDNHASTIGDVDEFITPAIDMSSITSPTMSFKVAYKRRSSTDTLDRLRVLTSTNCGISWVQKYYKDFSTLPTVTAVSANAFTPASTSEWRQETLNIASTAGASELRFKFEFAGHGVGNNIYIDDININGTLSVEEEFESAFGLTIFPNPFNENTTISFNIRDKYTVAVGLYDMIGKEIISISNDTELAPGSYSLPLNKGNLKPGIYFVKLEIEGYSAVKKMIVQ